MPSPTQALATRPRELVLEPTEGVLRFFGPLKPLALRLVSMVEQPAETLRQFITPAEGYFRRDRHRHPEVDAATYRLVVEGVAAPRVFTLEELAALPQEDRTCVMECAGNGNHLMGSAGLVGQACWRGPSLRTVLAAAGGPGPARYFAFRGLDPLRPFRSAYHYGLSLEELERAEALVALSMNGQPLPRPRGYPVRLVVPGVYSMSHVKWLGRIEGLTSPHQGIHNTFVFTNKERRDGRWVRVQARWIGVKSMLTACTEIAEGYLVRGFAWGGDAPIGRVEVTLDGGSSWVEATLEDPHTSGGSLRESGAETNNPPAEARGWHRGWTAFRVVWPRPSAGVYVLGSRAYDASGRGQPFEEPEHKRGHFDQVRVKWRRVRVPG